MTNIYIDCEFNGFNGELISMALVTSDGREWYEVLPLPKQIEPWVQTNVIPLLGKYSIPSDEFRLSLWRFLQQVDNPRVIADWYTDLSHFLSMFAGRHHGESVMYPCVMELRDVSDYESKVPHNALADARAIREALEGRTNAQAS